MQNDTEQTQKADHGMRGKPYKPKSDCLTIHRVMPITEKIVFNWNPRDHGFNYR
mgnify:CR=1 FL=1